MSFSDRKMLSFLVIGFFILMILPQNNLIINAKADSIDIISSFDSPGEYPGGLAWDGEYLWNADCIEDKFFQINPTNGSILKSVDFPFISAQGLTWDGEYLWNADFVFDKLYKIYPEAGGHSSYLEKENPKGIAWDGEYLYYSDFDLKKIHKINSTDGTVITSFDSPYGDSNFLTWDGEYLWSSNFLNSKIYTLDSTNGNIIKTYDSPIGDIKGLTWDGKYLWAVGNDTKIYKLEIKNDSNDELPKYFSWKDYLGKDWTTPAKDQSKYGYCGSCWAFAPTATLETIIKIREGNAEFNPDLSEQYIISCLEAGNKKGYGCFGGYPSEVYKCIIEETPNGNNCNGVVLESYFPYSSRFFKYVPSSDIKEGWEEHLVPIKNWGMKILNKTGDEKPWIKKTIMNKGPIVATLSVPLFFYSLKVPLIDPLHKWGYSIHNEDAYFPAGRPFLSFAGHVFSIVGWKDNDSIENGGYWIIENSWGTDWGYNGFANIEYGALYLDQSSNQIDSYVTWVDYDPESYSWPFES